MEKTRRVAPAGSHRSPVDNRQLRPQCRRFSAAYGGPDASLLSPTPMDTGPPSAASQHSLALVRSPGSEGSIAMARKGEISQARLRCD